MNSFSSIKELITTLYREVSLLSEMFKKRKSVKNFQYDYALDLVDNNDNRLKYLLDREVIRQNGNNLEIDDLFLHFFEQILNANEEINTSYVNESIAKIKHNIDYYLNETNDQRKYNYLREIKKSLRDIGNTTFRNVVDLKRNIDNTFKNEPNYKNKKAKLYNLDNKRKDIVKLIEQTEILLSTDSITFFKTATDEELSRIIVQLKIQLQKCTHNLIEIEKQIIDFLNQIQYQNTVIEKLRQIKYLKDQFTLETSTDLKSVLQKNNSVVFEPNPSYPLKLSLEFLQSDQDVYASILKISRQIHTGVKIALPLADKITEEYLKAQIEEVIQINLEEVKNGFVASSYNLLDFISGYQYPKDVSFDDIVNIYCQLVSQFDTLMEITDKYQEKENIEFATIYPK